MKLFHCIIIFIIIIQQTCELVKNKNEISSGMLLKSKIKQKQKHKSETRIVHGSDASPGQFPWHVKLSAFYLNSAIYFVCGGNILSATWVITTCHCLIGRDIFEIAVGSTRRHQQKQIQNTTKAFRHPKYDKTTYRNDVGLITFDKPLILNADIKPVALPTLTQSKNLFTGEKVTVCGFGRDYAQRFPYTLQYANLRVMRNDECRPYFGEIYINEQTMCVVGQQHKLESTCFGDSGSGAIAQIDRVPTIVGIDSLRQKDNCSMGKPTAFARVGYHIDWISKTSGIKVLP